MVVDGETRGPLAGATVRLERNGCFALTRHDGHYKVSAINPGPHTISVHLLSYAPHLDVVSSNDTPEIDAALRASPVVLNQVVTTVTGSHQCCGLET